MGARDGLNREFRVPGIIGLNGNGPAAVSLPSVVQREPFNDCATILEREDGKAVKRADSQKTCLCIEGDRVTKILLLSARKD